MRSFLALALVLVIGGCTQPRSARCRHVCERESECISATNSQIPFDEKECVAACAVLELDNENLAKVEEHSVCVANQKSCAGVLECK